MGYRRKLIIKPMDRLIENMEILDELIYGSKNIEDSDYWDRSAFESREPTSIDLLKFKISMERDIRRISRKIERKIGFEIPDGLKKNNY